MIYFIIQVILAAFIAHCLIKLGIIIGAEETLKKLISEKYIKHKKMPDGEIVFYRFDE